MQNYSNKVSGKSTKFLKVWNDTEKAILREKWWWTDLKGLYHWNSASYILESLRAVLLIAIFNGSEVDTWNASFQVTGIMLIWLWLLKVKNHTERELHLISQEYMSSICYLSFTSQTSNHFFFFLWKTNGTAGHKMGGIMLITPVL